MNVGCARNGHLPYLTKHNTYETGKSGQWVRVKDEPDDKTPVLGSQIHKGSIQGVLTAYCPNCYTGLIEQIE